MKRGYRLNSNAAFSRYTRTANFGIMGTLDKGAQWLGGKVLNPAAQAFKNRGQGFAGQSRELAEQATTAKNNALKANGNLFPRQYIDTDSTGALVQGKSFKNATKPGQTEELQGLIDQGNNLSNQANIARQQAGTNYQRSRFLRNNQNLKRGVGIGAVGLTGAAGLAGYNALNGQKNQNMY